MTIEQYIFILDLQTYLFGIGLLVTLLKIRKRERYMQLVALVFLASLLGNIAGILVRQFHIANVNVTSSIYGIIEVPIISLLYYFGVKKKFGKALTFTNVLYFIFAVSNLLFIQRSANNSYSNTASSIILLLFCIGYFYWLISHLPSNNLLSLPMFWVNTGFIIYCAGTFFLFVFTEYLINVLNNNFIMYWTMHNILGIVKSLLLIVAAIIELVNIKN